MTSCCCNCTVRTSVVPCTSTSCKQQGCNQPRGQVSITPSALPHHPLLESRLEETQVSGKKEEQHQNPHQWKVLLHYPCSLLLCSKPFGFLLHSSVVANLWLFRWNSSSHHLWSWAVPSGADANWNRTIFGVLQISHACHGSHLLGKTWSYIGYITA